MKWTGKNVEMAGFIPEMLSEHDPRPAREQLHTAYAHGGGWYPMQGWTYAAGNNTIKYPGDPTLHPIAKTQLRKEKIFVYPYAWVCIVQPDGTFEVARMD